MPGLTCCWPCELDEWPHYSNPASVRGIVRPCRALVSVLLEFKGKEHFLLLGAAILVRETKHIDIRR